MMPEMIHAKAIVIDDEFELTGSANLDERHPHAGGSGAASLKSTPTLYNPRHPERTLLYPTIAEHFETWHELAGLISSLAWAHHCAEPGRPEAPRLRVLW